MRSDMRVPRATHTRACPVQQQVRDNESPTHPHTLHVWTYSDTQQAGKQRFYEDAQSGVLYEKFMQHTGRTRDETKTAMLRSLYYDPKRWRKRRLADAYPDVASIIDAFPDLYPGVLEYVNEAKRKDHRKLSHDIQRDESYVVFNMICNAIRIQRPQTFVATIHDALLCKPEDAEFVRKVMYDQFQTLGTHPTIKQKPA